MNTPETVVTVTQVLFENPIMPAASNAGMCIATTTAMATYCTEMHIAHTVCRCIRQTRRHTVCIRCQDPTTKAFATWAFLGELVFGARGHLGVIQECVRVSVVQKFVHAAIVAGPIYLSSLI